MTERRAIQLLGGAALGFVVGCNAIIGLELGEPAESVGSPCSLSTECDDENPCTADACTAGRCAHLDDDGAAPDDGDACTADTCVNGGEKHAVQPGLACGEGGLLTCNAQGQCAGCTTAEQCGASSECETWACDATICVANQPAMGFEIPAQIAGDCKVRMCDGIGNAVEINDDVDVPADDGVICTDDVCNAGVAGHPQSAVGTSCTDAITFCNASGACVTCTETFGCGAGELCFNETECVSCSDMVTNGDEVGVDCGGSCPLCPAGQPCNMDGDCASGSCDDVTYVCTSCTDGILNGNEVNTDCGGSCPGCAVGAACTGPMDCASTFCADGVCCNTDCVGECRRCDLPGHGGTCTFLPSSMDDPGPPSCSGAIVCNGAGTCVADQDKAHYGDFCNMNSNCFNNTCDAEGICRLITGDPCTDDLQCASDDCDNASNTCI
jgi:hypothetical protein